MNKEKIASELLKIAKSLLGKGTKTIGNVEFEAVRKVNARGQKYWTFKVGRKEFDENYATVPKMWDDLERSYKAYGDDDRWEREFN